MLQLLIIIGTVRLAATDNNLGSLLRNDDLKFVFVGGKGGVGKTTTSSAIAAQLSLHQSKSKNHPNRVLLISTDSVCSLSDAWRLNFSTIPKQILPTLPDLEVMEVNLAEIMKKEMALWNELAQEQGYDPNAEDSGGGIGEKIYSFQEWLSAIPGIAEAVSLSSALDHIESGKYDIIVFDTAPTKLLELPEILHMGLKKLESWQSKLWGLFEMLKGAMKGQATSSMTLKGRVKQKLNEYKWIIGRVADMILNTKNTRFVIVCLAEHLAIQEGRHLLDDLDRLGVRASHIVVNQLVQDYMTESTVGTLQQVVTDLENNVDEREADPQGHHRQKYILRQAVKAAKQTIARGSTQRKYLQRLRQLPEVSRTRQKFPRDPLEILEVPLLPIELIGQEPILEFSQYLVGRKVGEEAKRPVAPQNEQTKDDAAADSRAEARLSKIARRGTSATTVEQTFAAPARSLKSKPLQSWIKAARDRFNTIARRKHEGPSNTKIDEKLGKTPLGRYKLENYKLRLAKKARESKSDNPYAAGEEVMPTRQHNNYIPHFDRPKDYFSQVDPMSPYDHIPRSLQDLESKNFRAKVAGRLAVPMPRAWDNLNTKVEERARNKRVLSSIPNERNRISDNLYAAGEETEQPTYGAPARKLEDEETKHRRAKVPKLDEAVKEDMYADHMRNWLRNCTQNSSAEWHGNAAPDVVMEEAKSERATDVIHFNRKVDDTEHEVAREELAQKKEVDDLASKVKKLEPVAVRNAEALAEDLEFKNMVEGNPKFTDKLNKAIQAMKMNPLAIHNIRKDPDIGPWMAKAVASLQGFMQDEARGDPMADLKGSFFEDKMEGKKPLSMSFVGGDLGSDAGRVGVVKSNAGGVGGVDGFGQISPAMTVISLFAAWGLVFIVRSFRKGSLTTCNLPLLTA